MDTRMVRKNRGSGVIRPWITPIHQNVKLAVCSRVTVSNFLLHFLVKNVYFFFFFFRIDLLHLCRE